MSARRRQAMDARVKARRDDVTRARLRRRRRVAASLAALALAAAAATGVAVSPLADITDVEVTGVDGDRLRQARSAADVHPGQNVLTVDLDAASSRVERIPWVSRVVARRRPPTTVEIAVLARTPVAVVATGGDSWLVDGDGVVVSDGADEQLPVVDAPGSEPPEVGGPVRDPAVRNALEMRSRLPEALRSRVVRYEAPSPEGLRLELDNGVTVRAGRAERVAEKAEAIALLLEHLRLADGDDAAGNVSAGDGAAGEASAGDGAAGEASAGGEPTGPDPAGPGDRGASRFADPDGPEDDADPRAVEIDVRAPDRPVVVPGGRRHEG